MAVSFEKNEKSLVAIIDGEIDHHTAKSIRESIDNRIISSPPAMLIMDFGGVTFMDSSGVGLIMGRYKLLGEYGGTLKVRKPPRSIQRMLKLSGVYKLNVMEEQI